MNEERLLYLANRHLSTEYSGDVQATMDTLADDVVYEHPFFGHVISGKENMPEYYKARWAEVPLVPGVTTRHWISGYDTIILENRAKPEGPPRNTALVVMQFRNDDLIRELSYSNANLKSYQLDPNEEQS